MPSLPLLTRPLVLVLDSVHSCSSALSLSPLSRDTGSGGSTLLCSACSPSLCAARGDVCRCARGRHDACASVCARQQQRRRRTAGHARVRLASVREQLAGTSPAASAIVLATSTSVSPGPSSASTDSPKRNMNEQRVRYRSRSRPLTHGRSAAAGMCSTHTAHLTCTTPPQTTDHHGFIGATRTLAPQIRSYHVEYTASHQNCEVKRRWAYLVLRWGTTWERYGAVSFLLFCL